MAYDRYERERRWRESRPEFSNERDPRAWDRNPEFERNREFGRDRDFGGDRNDRGFFERMGDEFRSWFGDEDDPRREQSRRDWEDDRNARERSRFGDPGRSREWSRGDEEFNRGYGHEQQRRGAFFSSARGSARDDLHYEDWRRRQMDDLDRDYDDYRRERQSRFEDDFGQWRNRRQSKRELLRGLREHMEVVGSDEQHVGTVDRVAGDRVILTRSDPQSGGAHHSLSCGDIDRVEGDRVILDCSADKARERWRDESRGRALFEREDQGRAGPGILDRSFSGTYR